MKENPKQPNNKSQDMKASLVSEITMTVKHPAYSHSLVSTGK